MSMPSTLRALRPLILGLAGGVAIIDANFLASEAAARILARARSWNAGGPSVNLSHKLGCDREFSTGAVTRGYISKVAGTTLFQPFGPVSNEPPHTLLKVAAKPWGGLWWKLACGIVSKARADCHTASSNNAFLPCHVLYERVFGDQPACLPGNRFFLVG